MIATFLRENPHLLDQPWPQVMPGARASLSQVAFFTSHGLSFLGGEDPIWVPWVQKATGIDDLIDLIDLDVMILDDINGNFRILKWRYRTIQDHILGGYPLT